MVPCEEEIYRTGRFVNSYLQTLKVNSISVVSYEFRMTQFYWVLKVIQYQLDCVAIGGTASLNQICPLIKT